MLFESSGVTVPGVFGWSDLAIFGSEVDLLLLRLPWLSRDVVSFRTTSSSSFVVDEWALIIIDDRVWKCYNRMGNIIHTWRDLGSQVGQIPNFPLFFSE